MNRTTDPTLEPASDRLAAPWGTQVLPLPVSGAVDFAAVPTCSVFGADLQQRLVHPWDGMRVPGPAPAPAPVSFASLAAPCRPVLPSQRPAAADLLPRQPLLGS